MKKIFFIFISQIIVIFIFFVIIELLSRTLLIKWISDEVIPKTRSKSGDYIFEYDPGLLWRHKPKLNIPLNIPALFVGAKEDVEVDYITNNLGLRHKEDTFNKRQRTYRIIFIGDSFLEAYGYPIKKNACSIFERNIKKVTLNGYNDIEVINAGVGAYNIKQYFDWLYYNQSKLKPDLVLICIYLGNDINFNYSGVNWKTKLLQILRRRFYCINIMTRIYYKIRWSMAGETLHEDYLKVHQLDERKDLVKIKEEYEKTEISGVEPNRLPEYIAKSSNFIYQILKKNHKKIRNKAFLAVRLCEEIARLGKEEDIAIVFILIPTKVQIDKRQRENMLQVLGAENEKIDIGQPNKIFGSMLRSKGMNVIDITEEMIKISSEKGELYYPACGTHWNELGNYYAGEIISRRILYSNILPVFSE